MASSSGGAPGDDGSLGNYKGVMLCNRPGIGDPGAEEVRPFIPSHRQSPFGVPPPYTYERKSLVAIKKGVEDKDLTKEKNVVKERHLAWLKSLEQKGKSAAEERSNEATKKTERNERLKVLADRYREDVREMMEQARTAKKQQKSIGKRSVPRWVKERWDNRIFEEALSLTRQDSAGKAANPQEDEDFPENAEELVEFASGLNFETFIDDLEFREALGAVRDRAKKLEREETLFRMNVAELVKETSDGGGGGAGGQQESVVDEEMEILRRKEKYVPKMPAGLAENYWGTAIVEEDAESEGVAQLVSDVMPKLRAIHSKASAEKVVEKAVSEC
ncbi:unnamed protein product [Amoebophrya sp. A25]|nr:unnamed protein product [Amoebophrya sp. A25]|eukprot:GSA25T00025719001.1